MKQFEFGAWIYSLLLALLLAAQSADAANVVRIAVPPSPMSLPFYVATERKFFEKHQVKPVLIGCGSGQDCIKILGEGGADIASSSELPLMFAAYERSPVSILATLATNNHSLKLLVSRNLLNEGQLNLVGKRIGYVPKSSSHYYLDTFLLFRGIDPKDVIEVPMAASELPVALVQGRVDAISVWEPWAEKTLNLAHGEVAHANAPRLYTLTFNVSVRNQFKNQQADTVHRVLKALSEAVDYIRDYPSRAQALLLRKKLVSQEHIEKSWHEYIFRMTLQQSLVSTLQGQARWARREGHIQSNLPEEPEYLDYIDASFLRLHKSDYVDFVYR
ncbi:ABC transporter substrate-binding protein [Limnobacter sp. P1]|jgi:NitT/TauT family transport system substrate-binding protein|uniref:ABC transporter substrate-binding protein n=1 Tax=Limnobacter olei TaxID=3031298 RepID=UPI0023AECABE|nr:ABC transporter substrate-binding protein [Limnobacter sp. P1]